MARNHLFTAKVWQNSAVREIRHAFSIKRIVRRISASDRRLPDYIVVGAMKSGTTSLWAYLSEHPLVEPAMMKEMHFFDKNYHRGVGWYRMHFPLEQSGRPRVGVKQSTLTGESSAYYML